ncbi:MAG: hypothetical protein RTU30_13095 [Candidatus Thorarchaeota archaeon]
MDKRETANRRKRKLGKRPPKKQLDEHHEELVKIFKDIDQKYPKLLIIVEGIRDEKVLRDLGVEAQILRTQSGLARPELAEKVLNEAGSDREVLILTDFDEEGKEIHNFLKTELELHRIKVLNRVRLAIRRNMPGLKCIEELVVLFKRRFSPEPMR